MTLIDTLRTQLGDVQARAKAITESTEDRSEAAEKNLVELLAEGEQVKARIAELVKLDELTAAGAQLDTLITGTATRQAAGAAAAAKLARAEQSMGEAFTASRAFTDWNGHGRSERFDLQERPSALQTRAPLTTLVDPGKAFVQPTRITAAQWQRQTPLLDTIGRVQVGANTVEWVTYPQASPLAAVVAEGAQKPEAVLTAQLLTVTLDTIAHYAEASRQLLEDSTAARDFINMELSRGVLDKLESNAADAITTASLATVDGTSLLAAIRAGVGQVQAAGFNPSVVLVNPADYADLDIAIMGSTLGGPVIGASFWGLRPVAIGAIPTGTAYVGDLQAAVTLLERTGVSVHITDSHAGNFTKNIFTILAEARAKAVVTRAEAIVKCTVTGP